MERDEYRIRDNKKIGKERETYWKTEELSGWLHWYVSTITDVFQSEESEYMWTHGKDDATWAFG